MILHRTLQTATLAAALLLGGYGFASAQAVKPDQPDSAKGGTTAHSGTAGSTGSTGSTTSSTTSNNTGAMGQTGGAQPSPSGHADAARGDTTRDSGGTDAGAAQSGKPANK
ncbi:MAG TPA: hypothetical protein VNZ61_13320 [Roseomonas sp.]|nr:hypothetical protein [Roseomonas sp.]